MKKDSPAPERKHQSTPDRDAQRSTQPYEYPRLARHLEPEARGQQGKKLRPQIGRVGDSIQNYRRSRETGYDNGQPNRWPVYKARAARKGQANC
jgi:hypothetical protein